MRPQNNYQLLRLPGGPFEKDFSVFYSRHVELDSLWLELRILLKDFLSESAASPS